jgi:hypothetical protein
MIMGHQFEVLENLIKALSVYLNTIYIRISFPTYYYFRNEDMGTMCRSYFDLRFVSRSFESYEKIIKEWGCLHCRSYK